MVKLEEGQVGREAGAGSITFSAVTSCVTVLVTVENKGSMFCVGAHLSLMKKGANYASNEIMQPFLNLFEPGDEIKKVLISGEGGLWSSDFITNKPLYDPHGNQQYSQGQYDALTKGLPEVGSVVSQQLQGRNIPGADDYDLYEYSNI